MIRVFIHLILCFCIFSTGISALFSNPAYSTEKTSLSFSEGTQIAKDKENNPYKFPNYSRLLFEEEKETKESVKDNIKVFYHFNSFFSIYDTFTKKYISLINFRDRFSSIPLYLLNSVFII